MRTFPQFSCTARAPAVMNMSQLQIFQHDVLRVFLFSRNAFIDIEEGDRRCLMYETDDRRCRLVLRRCLSSLNRIGLAFTFFRHDARDGPLLIQKM
jgi:hypothetical protein